MANRKSRHLEEKEGRIRGWSSADHAGLAALGISADDVIALEKAIYGQVVLPDDSSYDQARQLSDPAFQRFPPLVVYCATPGDVRHCLDFARRFSLPFTCRSGGHSTAGYSVRNDAMVIDTSRIQYVRISGEADAPLAHVGAGSNWGYVGAVLDSHGLHVPGGACEGVAIAGYMQGGGYGFTSRMFGMNCDNVVEVRVMLADGRIVIASDQQNVPMFWAIRGGTGNNFGILLEVTYRLYRLEPLWGVSVRWGIEDAARALFEMQNGYMKTNPSRRLGFQTQGMVSDGRQVVRIAGMHRGSENEAVDAFRPLLATQGANLDYRLQGSYYELNRRLDQDIGTNLPNGAKEDKQSGYLRAPMSLAEWENVIDMFTRTPNPYSLFNIEPYGGAINDVAAGSNAFVHRDAYCDFFLDTYWTDDADRAQSVRYLDDFMAMMQPYFDRPDGRPRSYQNYPRSTQTNYMDLYFDGFVKDLVTVKRLYDPTNFFRYEQSIPLEYPEDVRVDPASPGFTGNEEIVVEQL